MTIKKILIANRGEIAVRIINTCKKMGIKTVALCPEKGQEHNFIETSLADEYYFLEAEGSRGYLDIKKILEIAKKSRVDAIHPGYGFLSENWVFAKLCSKKGIKFIGPSQSTLKKLEDKVEAKKIAKNLGIPILPMSEGSISSLKDLRKWISRVSPPFVLKARKGGGGIGIRSINGEIAIGEIFTLALGIKRQIQSAFLDVEFFLEKYLPEAKHIEVQILGDGKRFMDLGERECTIQRRFQKILEEAPSPSIDERIRERLIRYSLALAKELKYENIGTVEFLMDKEGALYFLEVNPRIQVEHPVTELVYGIDLVERQIRIAMEEPVSFEKPEPRGWAMELRVNAEDPSLNFKPVTGKIEEVILPEREGIFYHTFLRNGQEIFPFFDPLIVKIVSWGTNRDEAVSKLKEVLKEIKIEGIKTNIPLFQLILEDKKFLSKEFYTNYLESSHILDQVKRLYICEAEPKHTISEELLAQLIYQIYCQFKGSSISEEESKKEVSLWQVIDRIKFFE